VDNGKLGINHPMLPMMVPAEDCGCRRMGPKTTKSLLKDGQLRESKNSAPQISRKSFTLQLQLLYLQLLLHLFKPAFEHCVLVVQASSGAREVR
jgi:hypothetical protein